MVYSTMRTLTALLLAMLLGTSANPQKPKPWKAVAAALVFACLSLVGCAAPVDEAPRPGCISVETSAERGLQTEAVVANPGDTDSPYRVQFGVRVNGLETFGVYWRGVLAPGGRTRLQQTFVFEPGDRCSEYFVIVTDPEGERMLTADCLYPT